MRNMRWIYEAISMRRIKRGTIVRMRIARNETNRTVLGNANLTLGQIDGKVKLKNHADMRGESTNVGWRFLDMMTSQLTLRSNFEYTKQLKHGKVNQNVKFTKSAYILYNAHYDFSRVTSWNSTEPFCWYFCNTNISRDGKEKLQK